MCPCLSTYRSVHLWSVCVIESCFVLFTHVIPSNTVNEYIQICNCTLKKQTSNLKKKAWGVGVGVETKIPLNFL